MAVRSITGSSGYGPNNVVQNLNQRDFSGNMEDTLLMTASSRKDLNITHNRNDDARNSESVDMAIFGR